MTTLSIYSTLNQFDPLNGERVSKDVRAVYQAIFNIINTEKGERMFLPDFGVDLEILLFRPISNTTAKQVLQTIVDAIERWEDRVSLKFSQSSVIPVYSPPGYNVNVAFSIKGLETQIFRYQGNIPAKNAA